MKRFTAALAGLCLVLAACGGGEKNDLSKKPEASSQLSGPGDRLVARWYTGTTVTLQGPAVNGVLPPPYTRSGTVVINVTGQIVPDAMVDAITDTSNNAFTDTIVTTGIGLKAAGDWAWDNLVPESPSSRLFTGPGSLVWGAYNGYRTFTADYQTVTVVKHAGDKPTVRIEQDSSSGETSDCDHNTPAGCHYIMECFGNASTGCPSVSGVPMVIRWTKCGTNNVPCPSAQITPPAEDFTLTFTEPAYPDAVVIRNIDTTNSVKPTVTATRLNGFIGAITLTYGAMPAGVVVNSPGNIDASPATTGGPTLVSNSTDPATNTVAVQICGHGTRRDGTTINKCYDQAVNVTFQQDCPHPQACVPRICEQYDGVCDPNGCLGCLFGQ